MKELLKAYQKLADEFGLKFLKFDNIPTVEDSGISWIQVIPIPRVPRQYTEALAGKLQAP